MQQLSLVFFRSVIAFLFLICPGFPACGSMSFLSSDADLRSFRSSQNFSYGGEEFYVERFDFSGKYLDLQEIDIDARRNKRVSLDCSGWFPVLKTVNYEGTFGVLNGNFTGEYDVLEYVSICCTSCKIHVSFEGIWKKNAVITISNRSEPICLRLPKNVGVVVQTKTALGGKVTVSQDYCQTKKGFRNKVFRNELAGTSPTLTFDIQTCDGGCITIL